MAVAYVDHTLFKVAYDTGVTNPTYSHVVPAGTNRTLVVFVFFDGVETLPTTVTYDGAALTREASEISGGAPSGAVYYLALGTSASPTTADVVITSSSGAWTLCYSVAINIAGALQSGTTCSAATNFRTDTSSPYTHTLYINSGVANSVIFSAGLWNDDAASPFTPNTGQTELEDGKTGSNTTYDWAYWLQYRYTTTVTNYSTGVTASAGGTSESVAFVAYPAPSEITVDSERNARTAGKVTAATSARNARTAGKVTGATSTRGARLMAPVVTTSARSARTAGKVTAAHSERNARAAGVVSALTDHRHARTAGVITGVHSERDARTIGCITVDGERDARTAGIVTGATSARGARTWGLDSTDNTSTRLARTAGKVTGATSARDARTLGGITVDGERDARTAGIVTGAANSRGARTAGVVTGATSTRNARTAGVVSGANDHRHARTAGVISGANDYRSARTLGGVTVASARNARTFGKLTAETSTRNARTAGVDSTGNISTRGARTAGVVVDRTDVRGARTEGEPERLDRATDITLEIWVNGVPTLTASKSVYEIGPYSWYALAPVGTHVFQAGDFIQFYVNTTCSKQDITALAEVQFDT